MTDQVAFEWRGDFDNTEMNELHAEAFGTRVFGNDEWDWRNLVDCHSLGWVVARSGDRLAGFVNVVSDGLVHAWLQDTMVALDMRGRRIGTEMVRVAADECDEPLSELGEPHVEALRHSGEARDQGGAEEEETVLAPELRVADGVETPGGNDGREQRRDAEVPDRPASRAIARMVATSEDGIRDGEQAAPCSFGRWETSGPVGRLRLR